MTLNRSNLRTGIREIVRDFYDIDTVGVGGINASSETLPVTTQNRYNAGDLIVIDNEQMRVRSLDDDGTSVTVTRGINLSTAAAHTAGVTITIRPEFTDRALNQVINSAIADTYPEIWLEINDESLSTVITQREYDMPSGFSFIRRIQIEGSDGFFRENRDWELIGTKIKFNKSFSTSGLTIRVIGQWYQPTLSNDTTNLELSDEQAEFIIYRAAVLALEMRIGARLKMTEYSAAVNDRAGQPLEMIQAFKYLRDEAERVRARENKGQMHGYMMRPIR